LLSITKSFPYLHAVLLSERGPRRSLGSPKSDLGSLGQSLGVVSRRICCCCFQRLAVGRLPAVFAAGLAASWALRARGIDTTPPKASNRLTDFKTRDNMRFPPQSFWITNGQSCLRAQTPARTDSIPRNWGIVRRPYSTIKGTIGPFPAEGIFFKSLHSSPPLHLAGHEGVTSVT